MNTSLSELLSGNVLIGSRALGVARFDSDWDIVCTMDTLDFVLERQDLISYDLCENGYEVCNKLESNEEEEYDDCDQGGFGPDLEMIAVCKFSSGLYINLFVYPNKKKFKLYKKLNKRLRKILEECKLDRYKVDRSEWVEWFIDEQYCLGINKDMR